VNGVHDLGGMHGMGPVVREADEPVFHHDWERRAFALTLAAGFLGKWNLDMSRFAREQMPPAEYLATSYYEHWLYGLEKLLADTGLVSGQEIERRVTAGAPKREVRPGPTPATEGVRTLRAQDVEAALRKARTARVDEDVPPRFKPGDRVMTRNIHPLGHTRLPRYARGKRGVIEQDYGVWVFPDTHASGGGKKPQHVYSVRFAARELWGPQASQRDRLYLDLWDDYLDPA
jgi:nitrile hydratase subunit beta